MANNRMFLLHIPTGKAVYLAKRMGLGWYNVHDNIKEELESLFDFLEKSCDGGSQDDFAIAMENCDGDCKHVFTDWDYTGFEKGVRNFKVKK